MKEAIAVSEMRREGQDEGGGEGKSLSVTDVLFLLRKNKVRERERGEERER